MFLNILKMSSDLYVCNKILSESLNEIINPEVLKNGLFIWNYLEIVLLLLKKQNLDHSYGWI